MQFLRNIKALILLLLMVGVIGNKAAHLSARETDTDLATEILADNDTEWSIMSDAWKWFIRFMRTTLTAEFLAEESSNNATAFKSGENHTNAESTAPRSVSAESRTFGKIRRMQMALIPIVFKFGVLSAMVAFLVALGMKSLFLLKLLVLMNAAAIVGKFLTLRTEYLPSSPPVYYTPPSNWNPYSPHGWGPNGPGSATGNSAQNKEIHLHIHGIPTPSYGSQQDPNFSYGPSNNYGWQRRNGLPHSSTEYASYSANVPMEVRTESILGSDVQSVEDLSQGYVPKNHRNF